MTHVTIKLVQIGDNCTLLVHLPECGRTVAHPRKQM